MSGVDRTPRGRRCPRGLRRRVCPLLFGGLAVLMVTGCTEEVQSEAAEETPPAADHRTPSAPEAGEGTEGYSTHLYSERDADVYSRLGGGGSEGGLPVDTIVARVGDRVDAGDVLAVLEDDEAQLEVAAARAPYRAAEAEHERVKGLHERGAATTAELERARFDKERKKAALDRAQLMLQRTRVRAPFAGVVSRRYAKVGERVTESTPLFRVTALSPLRARVLVPESPGDSLSPGTAVTVRGVDDDTATARVVVVAPTIDPASGTREVVVELDEPHGFEPGASVVVEPRPPEKPADDAGDGRASAEPTPNDGGGDGGVER